ncbi:cupin domain-containing protein [Sediminibacterium sp.]|uniref:cupin domain-containing protein n=1 Tax=Sediminibacterium sp. TaxID=1917865 RepID=UPI003F707CC9
MKRKEFFTKTAMLLPSIAIMGNLVAQKGSSKSSKSFVVDAGKSRFGEVVKFLGVHPNDLKISSKDTNGHLSVFDYVGTAKVGPMLHVHFEQDEIFTVIEGSYRFVVGNETHVLNAGQTIFLPRNIPHTWIQLTDYGRMIYFLQPAGKMEEFFSVMNKITSKPTEDEMNKIHAAHGMKVVGPPLSL